MLASLIQLQKHQGLLIIIINNIIIYTYSMFLIHITTLFTIDYRNFRCVLIN